MTKKKVVKKESPKVIMATIKVIYEELTALKDIKFKASFSVKVFKLIKLLDIHYQAYQHSNKQLFDKYGTLDEKTQRLEIAPNTDAYTNFIKELNEVLSEEISLDVQKLDVADFEQFDTTTKKYVDYPLSQQQILNLELILDLD